MTYSEEEVQAMLRGSTYKRKLLAENGYELETLLTDEDWQVRLRVAEQGYRLDVLVHDEDWSVRCEVAMHDYRLDILVNDEMENVRCHVAEKGYGLNILVHDDSWQVRLEVAKQCYRLDILVRDINDTVRAVAESLVGSKRRRIASNFGTYNGNLALYTWEDRYLIKAGCYSSSSVNDWEEKCEEQIDKETAMKYAKVMRDILKGGK